MSFWGNHSCPHEAAEKDPVPFYDAVGGWTIKGRSLFLPILATGGARAHRPSPAHHLGWTVAGFLALISTTVSAWLIVKHLTYFTNRPQQRQIIRILLMVPIYACASALSYVFRHQAVYFHVVRGPSPLFKAWYELPLTSMPLGLVPLRLLRGERAPLGDRLRRRQQELTILVPIGRPLSSPLSSTSSSPTSERTSKSNAPSFGGSSSRSGCGTPSTRQVSCVGSR
jgi:hypothetical protein